MLTYKMLRHAGDAGPDVALCVVTNIGIPLIASVNPFGVGASAIETQWNNQQGNADMVSVVVEIADYGTSNGNPYVATVYPFFWVDGSVAQFTLVELGSTKIDGGVLGMYVPDTNYTFDLVDADAWPSTSVSFAELPRILADGNDGSTPCPNGVEITFDGSGTGRVKATFIIQGPTAGASNTFLEYLDATISSVGVSLSCASANASTQSSVMVTKFAAWGYIIGGALPMTVGGNTKSVDGSGASSVEIGALNAAGFMTTVGAILFGGQMDGVIVSGASTVPTGDATIVPGGLNIPSDLRFFAEMSGAGAPYTGQSLVLANIGGGNNAFGQELYSSQELGLLPIPDETITLNYF